MGIFTQKWLVLVCVILLIPLINAAPQAITENQITIISDKTTYNCEPIYNEKGECLINAEITIKYNVPQPTPITIISEYSTETSKTKFTQEKIYNEKDPKAPIKTEKKELSTLTANAISEKKILLTKDFRSISATADVPLLKDEVLITKVSFWAKENGKFNIRVNNGKVETTLDPFYNITSNSTIPTLYCVNGTARNMSTGEFEQCTDVSAGLSDNNVLTAYETTFGGLLYENDAIAYWSMNEITSSNIIHDYRGINNLYTIGSTTPFNGSYYSAQQFDGYDFLYAQDHPSFDFTTNFSMCIKMNTTSGTAGQYFINKYQSGTGARGYFMLFGAPRMPQVTMYGSLGSISTQSNITLNTTSHHIICFTYGDPITKIYVDGVVSGTLSTRNFSVGSVDNNHQLFLGTTALGGGSRIVAGIWEFAMWNRTLSDTDVTQISSSTSLFNDFTKSKTINPFFNYTTNCSTCNYYLKIIADNPTPIPYQIMPYTNMTSVNSSKYLRTNLISGENFININSIIDLSYNLPFRIYNFVDGYSKISEIALTEVGDDNNSPTITNCQIDDTDLTCFETARVSCEVNDDVGIQSVYINFNGSTYGLSDNLANRLFDGIFYVDTQIWDVITQPTLISVTSVNATDLGGNSLSIDPSLSFWYNCTCEEDWQTYYTDCDYNDTHIKYYQDANACETFFDFPTDNGTIEPCDYCVPNITQTYIDNCTTINGSVVQQYTYTDLNYYSCCALTGLPSDCIVDYEPYNHTFTEACILPQGDFQVEYAEICEFDLKTDDRCYWKIYLNGTTGDYKCLTYIRTTDNKLIQTNPTYTAKTDNLISWTSEYEDRQYFLTANGLANVYFTKENLIIDGRPYVFSVECSDGNSSLQVDKAVIPAYSDINTPVTRGVWGITQMSTIVFSIIGIIIILFVVAIIWNIHKRNT